MRRFCFLEPVTLVRELPSEPAGRTVVGDRLVALGRGINAYAFMSGPTPVPTQSDGRYQAAELTVTSVAEDMYSYDPNVSG